MDHFKYQDGQLFAEQCSVAALAEQFGTPLYVYSRATLERHYQAFDQAIGDYPHHICYSVKANSNLGVLSLLAQQGSWFDIVSGGELARVIAATGHGRHVIFSGVGKSCEEIDQALDAQIACFNIESLPELQRVAERAAKKQTIAPISVRINPDVDAKTHPYISTGLKHNKFGVSIENAHSLYDFAAEHPHLNIIGVACHIGSQLTDTTPFADALDRVIAFAQQLSDKGITLSHLDFGGGLGVRYHDETPPTPAEYWQVLKARLDAHGVTLPIHIEPGRAIAANAGILVTEVQYLKSGDISHFCIVNAAMNDLIRPALYSAYQEIIEVSQKDLPSKTYDVVGPICESADFLGKDRALKVEPGDLLAVRTTGAYGATLASNYNSRPRAAEIMVEGSRATVVRQRETLDSLFALETTL